MKNTLFKFCSYLLAAGAALSPLEKINGQVYQALNPAPATAPLVPGQVQKTANPGLYKFNGTLVDVTDRKTALPGKILTFYSPEGVSYTVTSQPDGTFVRDIDTGIEDNRPSNGIVGYRSLNTAYDGNVKHIRFEAPESARDAKVRIFNILGQEVAEANYTLNGAGMFDVPRAPGSELASGMYLAQIETRDNSGKTHDLGNIKIQNRAGNGGRGFLISEGNLSAGERPQNARVTYDEATEEGKRLARVSAGLEQWTLEISDPSGEYVTHRKHLLAQEGQNNLGLEDMLPADTTFIRQLDESFRRGEHINRMDGKKVVYVNTETGHIAEQTKTRILDYLTIDSGGAHNGILDSLTLGNQRYGVSDVNFTNTAGLPAWGTDSTWVFDYDGTNSFAIWADGHGKITAAYVNLTNREATPATNHAALQEMFSCVCGIDDYNEVPSLFNDIPGLYFETPTEFDKKGFFYIFNRRPGTKGVGVEDDETAPGNLQKTAAPRFDPSKLTPEDKTAYDRLCANSVRPPDYFRVLDQ